MKALLKGFPVLAAAMLAAPACADDATVRMAVDAARLKIPGYCNLQNWQFALTLNGQGLTRVELSPTMSPDQIQCVYQSLSDSNIPLDRPAPVQVNQSSIRPSPSSPSN